MPAQISVVIPTLNAASALPATADALLEGVTDGLIGELILSDGGSGDEITEVAEALGAELITGAPGRGGQIARGVAEARFDWVLILHADTHLSEGWARAARAHMQDHKGDAGWFRLAFRARGLAPRITAGGANLRSKLFDLPYGDQGLLVARTTLARAGGVPELPLMEDVALARRLKGHLRPIEATAQTSAARYLAEGWLRRIARNLTTLTRYALGAKPENLAARYSKR
ncbi:MAG: TIGR04283 family arsenosugar biosynthesis glycosyltransferase [Silicimonas sp.]|nr:TIGR04283 family arsenosugar biosynthesis glycosyltransferase [Silicimonas sp.]